MLCNKIDIWQSVLKYSTSVMVYLWSFVKQKMSSWETTGSFSHSYLFCLLDVWVWGVGIISKNEHYRELRWFFFEPTSFWLFWLLIILYFIYDCLLCLTYVWPSSPPSTGYLLYWSTMQFDLVSNASEVLLLHQLSIISPSLLKFLPGEKYRYLVRAFSWFSKKHDCGQNAVA